MGECVCNSCKNLKGIMDENGSINEYECEFGFPAEACSECNEDECSLTCSNYASDDEEELPVIVKCKGCGKELKQVCSDGGEGEAFCFECYLNK